MRKMIGEICCLLAKGTMYKKVIESDLKNNVPGREIARKIYLSFPLLPCYLMLLMIYNPSAGRGVK